MVKRALGLLCVVVALVGCKETAGGDSPSAVFDRAKAAMEAKDYGQVFRCFNPYKRHEVLAGIELGCGFVGLEDPEKAEELEGILSKHGLVGAAKTEADEDAEAPSLEEYAQQEALFVDLMQFMERYAGEAPSFGALDGDVEVDKDTATGTHQVEGGEARPLFFTRVDGRWYLDPRG